MRFTPIFTSIFALSLAALTACGGGGAGGSGGAGGNGTSGGGGSGGAAPTPLCTMPTTVACSDQIILQMNFQPDPVNATISNTADGAGWNTHVDATAGGAFTSMPTAYTYGKFTDQGLVRVDVSDEGSLTSMDWDIAFRRYVVRVNSGDSGPSCVQAARVPGTTKFEDLDATPDNLLYHTDDTFTDSCDLIPDGSGLPDSPATALSSYWTYPGCVQMTGYVYVIALADGHHVKFTVDDYYSPTVQDQCQTQGAIPMTNTGSANFIVRWAYLP